MRLCSRYLHKDWCVTEKNVTKNSVCDKPEAVCMLCSIKFNINHSADISVHDLIESSTNCKLENVVSNPTYENFFENCAYHDQKSLNNTAISKKPFYYALQHSKSAKNFDSLAHYSLILQRAPDVMAISDLKLLKTRCIFTSIYVPTCFFIATAKPKWEVWHFTLSNHSRLAKRTI